MLLPYRGIVVPRGSLGRHHSRVLTYAQEVLADAPLAYWRAGNALDSATLLKDASGNGRDATAAATGGTVTTSGGPVAGGGSVAITSGYLSPAATIWQPASFTLECWLLDSSTGSGGKRPVAAMGTVSGVGTGGWVAGHDFSGGGQLTVGANDTVGNGGTAMLTTPATGSWRHLAFTMNAIAGNQGILYVDGAQVTFGNGLFYSSDATSRQAGIGRTGSVANASLTPWLGSVAEVAIYGAALSAARIAAHYAARNN